MRLRHRFKIDGLILWAIRSVLGHPQRGSTQERGKCAAHGEAHENLRLNRSLMDNRNHGVCNLCLESRPAHSLS